MDAHAPVCGYGAAPAGAGVSVNSPALASPHSGELVMSAGADSGRWADVKERGHYWGMALLVMLYRVFGRWLLYPLVGVVVTYFFLTRRATRRYSALYLRRVLGRRVRLWDVWRQDRKSTRLNSSHVAISYAVFCSN